MAATVFATPRNNCSTTVGPGGYTAGAGTLTVAAGGGVLFPALSGGSYCRVTVIQNAVAYVPNAGASTYTIFKVTAITGDVLTIAGTLEGTSDRNYVVGDVVEVRVTGGSLADIHGAVNTLETTVPTLAPLASPALTGTPTAPTAPAGTNTTQVATTAFVQSSLQSGHGICQGRLTLTSGDPIELSGSGSTLYFTPFQGAHIGLYDGVSQWNILSFPEIAVAVPGSTGLYDVFAYNNAGVVALEFGTVWTNSGFGLAAAGTRNQLLVRQDGVWVKSGAPARRYLGTLFSNTGTATDTLQARTLWNYANRIPKKIYTDEVAANWTDATTSWRLVNNNANSKSFVSVVVGVKEVAALLQVGLTTVPATGFNSQTSIFYDSAAQVADFVVQANAQGGVLVTAFSSVVVLPDIGYHNYTWMEYVSGGTATHYSTNSGLSGTFAC